MITLPAPDFENTLVFRIENEYGEGIFSGGGVRFIPEEYFLKNPPAEKAGFHPLVYNLLSRGVAKSGCKSYSDLVSLFSIEVIDKLKQNGFKVVQTLASKGWESSGQIIFIPESVVL